MKLLLIDYLASLRERGEIDAMLVDLISEMGGTVVKIARRGEREQGKDVCAAFDVDGVKELWIFVIKQGNLTEDVWQGSGKMRADAEAALDVPFEDESRGITRTTKRRVILLHNGTESQMMRERVSGFCEETKRNRGVDVERWDLYGLADRCEQFLLNERLLLNPDAQQRLRQTLVFVGTPDYDLRHLNKLLAGLLQGDEKSPKAIRRTFAAVRLILRLIEKYIGTGDIRTAIKAHELALLRCWDWLLRLGLASDEKCKADIQVGLVQYMTVLREYVSRIYPRVGTPYGLGIGGYSERVEYPMRAFEVLSNLSMLMILARCFQENEGAAQTREVLVTVALQNPAAMHPLVDSQSVDIAFVTFALLFIGDRDSARGWVVGQLDRLLFRLKTRRKLPELYNRLDLVIEYEATGKPPLMYEDSASLLMYMLFELLVVVEARDAYERLRPEFTPFTVNLQLWYPPEDVEKEMFVCEVRRGDTETSIALPPTYDAFVEDVRARNANFDRPLQLTTVQTGLWMLLLVASKYYGTPLFPFMWRAFAPSLKQPDDPKES